MQNMEYNMKDNVQRMKNNKYYIQSLGGKKMSNIDMMSANAIRVLAADAVQKANSGHPGLPLGSAAMAYELWAKHMNHNPKNPKWENRDRFIIPVRLRHRVRNDEWNGYKVVCPFCYFNRQFPKNYKERKNGETNYEYAHGCPSGNDDSSGDGNSF